MKSKTYRLLALVFLFSPIVSHAQGYYGVLSKQYDDAYLNKVCSYLTAEYDEAYYEQNFYTKEETIRNSSETDKQKGQEMATLTQEEDKFNNIWNDKFSRCLSTVGADGYTQTSSQSTQTLHTDGASLSDPAYNTRLRYSQTLQSGGYYLLSDWTDSDYQKYGDLVFEDNVPIDIIRAKAPQWFIDQNASKLVTTATSLPVNAPVAQTVVPLNTPQSITKRVNEKIDTKQDDVMKVTESSTTSTTTQDKIEVTQEQLDKLVQQKVEQAMEQQSSTSQPIVNPVHTSLLKRIVNFLFGWL